MPFLPQCLHLWKASFHKSRITPCNNIGEWEQPSWIVPKTGKYRLIQTRNFYFPNRDQIIQCLAVNVAGDILHTLTDGTMGGCNQWNIQTPEMVHRGRKPKHLSQHRASIIWREWEPCLWKTLRSEAASDFGSRGMTPTCQADPSPGVRRADVTQSNTTKWPSRGTSGKELTWDAGCRHWEMWGHHVTVTWCYIVTSLRQGVNLKTPIMLLLLPHSLSDDHAWDCTTLSINAQLC